MIHPLPSVSQSGIFSQTPNKVRSCIAVGAGILTYSWYVSSCIGELTHVVDWPCNIMVYQAVIHMIYRAVIHIVCRAVNHMVYRAVIDVNI